MCIRDRENVVYFLSPTEINNLNENSIKLFDPIPKNELFKKLRESRVMLYQGDPGETFCLSIAEAQALGVPCVIKPIGCLGERVIDELFK